MKYIFLALLLVITLSYLDKIYHGMSISYNNINKKYKYTLWIRYQGEEFVIYLYSNTKQYTISDIKKKFFERSLKALVFKTEQGEIVIPVSQISSIKLNIDEFLYD